MTRPASPQAFGALLRDWRRRRSLSQLALAAEAEISQRHLSFMESGRSAPSREMVLRIAEQLAVPLRERNALLAAAGFAPVFRERDPADPDFAAAMDAIALILKRHEPFPALAIDRHWTLLHANAPVGRLLAGVDAALLEPPMNVLRVSLHPRGLAGRILNFRQWKRHILGRLADQIGLTADPALIALAEELSAYPTPPGAAAFNGRLPPPGAGLAIPFDLSTPDGPMSFLSATTIFGTALDITLSEIAIESFFPADDRTRDSLFRMMPA